MSITFPAGTARPSRRAWPTWARIPTWRLEPPGPVRAAQLALGLIWLLDAALQFQPYMFTKAFVTQIIEPTASGNPGILSHSVMWSAHVMIHHIALYNSVFATIQLLLALGLFWKPTVRLALAASIVWTLFVWWFGEGLGGIFVTGVDAFMGTPGGVILYAFAAILVWPRLADHGDPPTEYSIAAESPLGRTLPRIGWLALWGSFAYQQLEPADRSPSSLGGMVAGMSPGQPTWIRRIDSGLGSALAHHGTEVSIVAAVVFALIGVGVFVPRLLRPILVAAVVAALAIWTVENFGGIFTGSGTDPNSGLPLVLLAALFWPVRHLTRDRVGSAPVATEG
jgi:hypothetical protein